MAEQLIPWAALAILFLLCLPIPGVARAIVAVGSLVLRLALLAVLAGAAYLWFRPADLPAAVPDALAAYPRLVAALPDPASPNFGIALAAPVVAALLPLLAVLDVCRRAARRFPECDRPAVVAEAPAGAPVVRTPPPRPVGRAAAADAIASAGPRPRR